VAQVANKWLLGTGLAAAAATMLIGRLGGPRNALIAMAVFAIIIAGHPFNLRWHGRNILSLSRFRCFFLKHKQLPPDSGRCNFAFETMAPLREWRDHRPVVRGGLGSEASVPERNFPRIPSSIPLPPPAT